MFPCGCDSSSDASNPAKPTFLLNLTFFLLLVMLSSLHLLKIAITYSLSVLPHTKISSTNFLHPLQPLLASSDLLMNSFPEALRPWRQRSYTKVPFSMMNICTANISAVIGTTFCSTLFQAVDKMYF